MPCMNTDWNLLRRMMATAIDSCEAIEALEMEDADRARAVAVGGVQVSAWDFLTSAWTYPENLRYQIVRERHAAGNDLPFVPPAARTLVQMAQACAELVGAGEQADGPGKPGGAPAEAQVEAMLAWYRDHLVPGLRAAMASPLEQAPGAGSTGGGQA
jgi:hypothetical protein